MQFVADEHDVGCYAVIDRTDNNADAETALVSPSDFLIQFHVCSLRHTGFCLPLRSCTARAIIRSSDINFLHQEEADMVLVRAIFSPFQQPYRICNNIVEDTQRCTECKRVFQRCGVKRDALIDQELEAASCKSNKLPEPPVRSTETVSFADECSGSSQLKRRGGRACSAQPPAIGRVAITSSGSGQWAASTRAA